MSSGSLSVVATPIGNLKDITLRAVEVLKAADQIACEDTRHSGILLRAYGIETPRTSFHGYSAPSVEKHLIEAMVRGKRVALISDAGLPGISDPGVSLIQSAIKAGVSVTVIPGASASLTALVASGFPTDRFVFEGFLPIKPGARRNRLEALKKEPRTVILFESPHRLLKMLEAIEAVYGDVRLSCSREMTKRFEETRRERVSALRAHFMEQAPRGEFVLVIPPERMRRDNQ